jgi:hypothetical protein
MEHTRWMLDKQGYTRAHTHKDEYVILAAFSLLQRFAKAPQMLRYTYIACLVLYLVLLQ